MTVGLLDPKITVAITISQLPAELQDFSVLLLPSPGTVTFSEDVKRYSSPSEVATDLAAGEISAATAADLNAVFALDRRPAQIAVGKLPAGTAEITTVTIGGTPDAGGGYDYVLNVDGVEVTYTTIGGDGTGDVATGLADLLSPLTTGLYTIDDGSGSGIITITSLIGTNPTKIIVSTADPGGTITADAPSTPATAPSGALDTLFALDSDWFALVTELKTPGWQEEVADWCESNKRWFWAQTSDLRVTTNDANGIGQYAVTNSLNWTSILFRSDSSEEFALLNAARFLSFDPDNFAATPNKSRLAGITADTALTSSLVSNLEDDGVAYYHLLRGTPCSSGVFTGSGLTAEARLAISWLEARLGESLAAMLLTAASRGQRIPYDDFGFGRAQARAQAVLDRGVTIGHLRTVLDDTSGARTSPVATVPRRSAVSAGDAAALRIPVSFVAHIANTADAVSVTGHVTDVEV